MLPEPVLAVLVVRVPTVLPVDPLEERKTTDADWTRRRRPPVVTSGHDSLVSVVVQALHPLLRHKTGAREEQEEQGGIDDVWQRRSCCSFGGSKPVTVLRSTIRKAADFAQQRTDTLITAAERSRRLIIRTSDRWAFMHDELPLWRHSTP